VKSSLLKRAAPPLFLGALLILFFPKLVSLAYLPAAKDTLTFSYPAQVELGRALHAGYFPLWSTHLNSPLFAEGQGAFAHPLALLLFAALPPAAASNLFLLLHVYAGLIFTYLFCRDLGQSRLAGTLAAVAFGLGGFFLARLGIYTLLTNGVWLPGLLWLAVRYARTHDLRYALAGGLGGALAVLAGQFQLASYAVVAAAIYAAVYVKPRRHAIAALLCFGALPLVLAAVQLVPTFELWRLSERAGSTRPGEYSLWPPQYLQLILPDVFGRAPHPSFAPLADAQADSYWGRGSFVESASYVGIFPLLLAVGGFIKKRRWFFIILLGLAALFACGTFTPLFHIYKYVPPFCLFRAPSRLLLYVALALAVGAGDGLDAFVRSRSRAFVVSALVALGLAVAVTVTFRYSLPQLRTAVERTADAKAEAVAAKFGNAEAVRDYYRVKGKVMFRKAFRAAGLRNPATFFQLGLIGAAVVIFVGARRHRTVAAVAPYIIILLTVVDLYRYGEGLNPTVRASFVNRPPPPAAAFGEQPGRIYSNGFSLDENKYLGLGLVHENTHAIWGYDLLVPRASLRPAYAVTAFEILEDLYTTASDPGGGRMARPTAEAARVLRAYGITHVVRLTPWRGDGVSPVASSPPYYVYECGVSAPRARAVPDYTVVPDDEAALGVMLGDGFDPAERAVIFEELAAFDRPGAAGPVELTRESPLRATCAVTGPTLLLFDDLYYPGWKATVDGTPTEIYRANVISRAVVVPPGPHTVEYRFVPTSFYAGLAVSLASFAAVFAFLIILTVRRKRSPGAEEA
jgi:hypothetical protein